MSKRLRRAWRVGVVCAALLVSACASGANHTLHELDQMPILHRPPPGGTELGTQQDRGTFVGRQAGILTVYATSRPAEVVIGYYRTTYPSFHFKPEDYPPSGTVSFIGSQRYAGGTANAFVRIRDGSPWIEDGYSIEPRPAPSGATTFVTVLLLGVPD